MSLLILKVSSHNNYLTICSPSKNTFPSKNTLALYHYYFNKKIINNKT